MPTCAGSPGAKSATCRVSVLNSRNAGCLAVEFTWRRILRADLSAGGCQPRTPGKPAGVRDDAGGRDGPGEQESRRHALAVRTEKRFETSLGATRLLFVIPVVFLLLDAAAAFIYGA